MRGRAFAHLLVSGAAAAALAALCACAGQAQQARPAAAESSDAAWLDEFIAETNASAAEAEAAPPASDWNEIPLSDGTYAGRESGYRADRIEIPVPANGGALEYKLQMSEGDAVVYSWTAQGLSDPALLLSEFHGHTERVGDAPGTLMFYRRGTGASESGALTAPFTGIHGWYLENGSDADIVVTLDVAGFYEIVPGQLE